MDQPKIPTLKDSQKPQVKVRGLGAGLSFIDRMKQFNKKDLAFILAGLGTLFMAPLAEHFMMSPDNGDASLSPGFGSGKGAGPGIFGAEDRTSDGSGTAVGSPVGGSDVITPLNVRDPSSLIMGPGSSSQPPTNSSASVAPPVSAPGRSDQDVRDALAGAASHAASAAVKKSLMPVPKIGLSGSSLRGLGVATGNSSATAGGGVSTQGLGLGGHGNVANNMAGVKGGDKIASVGPRGLTTGADALTALKAAGDKAGGMFDRAAGSAQGNLNAAANEAIPSGGGQSAGGGSGPGGGGPGDKGGNGSGPKDSKSGGESLAYELMKQNLQKQLELYWKEQEAMDPTLELYKMRNSMAEAIAGTVGTTIGNFVGGGMTGILCKSQLFSNSVGACFGLQASYSCVPTDPNGNNLASATPILVNNFGGTGVGSTCQPLSSSTGVGTPGNATTTTVATLAWQHDNIYTYCPTMQMVKCGGGTPTSSTPGGGNGGGAVAAVNQLTAVCGSVASASDTSSSGGFVSATSQSPAAVAWLKGAKSQLGSLATARGELTGTNDGTCGAGPVSQDMQVPFQQSQVAVNIQNAMMALTQGGGVVNQDLKDGTKGLTDAITLVNSAQTAFTKAANGITAAQGLISGYKLTAYTGSDCPACGPVGLNGTTVQGGLTKTLASANQLQNNLQKLLTQAQTAVQGAVPSAPPSDPSAAKAAPPTVQQVLQVNSLADNLNTALKKSQSALAAPALQAANAAPDGSNDAATQATSVDGQVEKAYTAIAAACSGLGFAKDCTGDPSPVKPPQNPTAQTDITAVATAVNGARNAQWAVLSSIHANAATVMSSAAPGGGVAASAPGNTAH